MELGLAMEWARSTGGRPEGDDERLAALMNLATALDNEGKHAEAEEIYRKMLAVQKRVLGKDHFNTLMTASNLPITLKKQGKHAEAEEMYRETLVVQRRVLGDDHPHTLATASNVAITLDRQGKYGRRDFMR